MEKREKKKVLLLCTGNSCRSQLAEGLVRKFLGSHIDAYSAGTFPVGVHPNVIRVLKELDVDTSSLYSKHFSEFKNVNFDLVVTLCDGARDECPHFPNALETVHMPFDDPYFATGTEEEIMREFRRVRDEIKERLIEYLKNHFHIGGEGENSLEE